MWAKPLLIIKQFLGWAGLHLSNFNIYTAFKLTFALNNTYPGGGRAFEIKWNEEHDKIP